MTLAGDFPDPSILATGGEYYAYSTGSIQTFAQVQVMQSPDLVHWTMVGDAFAGPGLNAASPSGWASPFFGTTWAPAVIELPANPADQRFVLYYAASSQLADATNGKQCIGHAVSASPVGPFVDSAAGPLVCTPERGGSIDPEPVAGADGSLTLLWKSEGVAGSEPTRIWSTPLSTDGAALAGGATELLVTAAGSGEEPIIESPTVVPRENGGYWLFYSSNRWETPNYAVGVARCDSLQGPCTRVYSTPVLASREATVGPGGVHAFQDLAGNWQIAFAAWTAPYVGYVNLDPFEPDSRFARSLHILPLGSTKGGLPSIG